MRRLSCIRFANQVAVLIVHMQEQALLLEVNSDFGLNLSILEVFEGCFCQGVIDVGEILSEIVHELQLLRSTSLI